MSDDDQVSDAPDAAEDTRERERRFLVKDSQIVDGHAWRLITQAYVPTHAGGAVRIRIIQYPLDADDMEAMEEAYLGVKGKRVAGERWEEEFRLQSLVDAKDFVATAPYVIQKRRYSFVDGDGTWEVDIFYGSNEGLVIAELEGKGDWIWTVPAPEWALREVTHEERYNNEQLAEHPISTWAADWQADAGLDFDDDVDWLAE